MANYYSSCTSSSETGSTLDYKAEFEDGMSDKELHYVSGQVTPYSKEPTQSTARRKCQSVSSQSTKGKDKCLCKKCGNMVSLSEQVCCHHHTLNGKRKDKDNMYLCINEHPMFEQGVLNRYAQELAWRSYADQYGREAYISENENDWRRHISYRQAARWAWDRLGRNVRRVLPACVVTEIRSRYPNNDGQYRNFQDS